MRPQPTAPAAGRSEHRQPRATKPDPTGRKPAPTPRSLQSSFVGVGADYSTRGGRVIGCGAGVVVIEPLLTGARGRSLAAAFSPGHNRSVKAPSDSRAGRQPGHPDSAEVRSIRHSSCQPAQNAGNRLSRRRFVKLAAAGASSLVALPGFLRRRIPTASSTSRSLPPAAGASATPAESVPKTSSRCATSTSQDSSRRRKNTPRPSASRISARSSTGRTTSTPWWSAPASTRTRLPR